MSILVSFPSCEEKGDDELLSEIDQSGSSSTNQSSLSEEKVMSIIDNNVNAGATYTKTNYYRPFITCEITTTIGNQIPNANIKYGLEYGLVEPNLFYVEFNEWNGSKSKLNVKITTIQKNNEEESNQKLAAYTSHLSSYDALMKKSSASLTTSERNLLSQLKQKLSEFTTNCEKTFKARTYVSVNGTRYYFSTIEIVNSKITIKKHNCHTDFERTETTICDWCNGNGDCAAIHCNYGKCTECNGKGYTYKYVVGVGNTKETCYYCNGGKCNSCKGTNRCGRCGGKGSITSTIGGNATVMGGTVNSEGYPNTSGSTGGNNGENSNSTGISNNHESVDLGLPSGLKWATCNVGANSPEEYGDYFAWGETEPQASNSYSWDSYRWCNGSRYTMTKYGTDSSFGTVDNKIVLDLEDDAAHANWGGSWRMPTVEEQDELLINCTWIWTAQKGVNGYTVTGPNGHSIFLPAAGTRSSAPYDGNYWSSSLSPTFGHRAFHLFFYPTNWSRSDSGSRCYGNSVRAVCP